MQRIAFNIPSVVGNELIYLQNAATCGHLAGDGLYTKRCNELIVSCTGAAHALLTHSGTAALEMAAILCDLKPGDEVIMPSWTFVSTANAVVLRGAVPVFVDVKEDTLNIDPQKVEEAVNPRTKAIFVVHYAGVLADIGELRSIADKYGLLLVEDAAQAFGAVRGGKPAGSFGDMAAFSFHETKNIVSGEGGALVLNNESLIERAEIIREKGTDRTKFFRGEVDKYCWVDIGSSYLPSELVAAFLLGQLEKEYEVRQKRLELWSYYDSELSTCSSTLPFRLPQVPRDCKHNGHMYYLMMVDIQQRNLFIEELKEYGISAPFHYSPLHQSPAGEKYARVHSKMTQTERAGECVVRLPLYYGMDNKDVLRVIEVIKSVSEKFIF